MNYREDIKSFVPGNEQEETDKRLMLKYIECYGDGILYRNNELAHMTVSCLILNGALDKILMVHHNIYNTWSWTGGHADGDADLLAVAIKEAREETGIKRAAPLIDAIVSLDILPVYGHFKKGSYVSVHIHLNATYVLIASEDEAVAAKEDENSGVMWIDVDRLAEFSNEPYLIDIYRKIVNRARVLKK